MSINQFNLFLKEKNIGMNVKQSIHKGNFFFRILFFMLEFVGILSEHN